MRILISSFLIFLGTALTACDNKPPENRKTPPSATATKWQPTRLLNKWEIDPSRLSLAKAALATPVLHGFSEVPFAKLKAGSMNGRVFFDVRTKRSQIRMDNGAVVAFQRPGIPLWLQQVDDNRYVIAFRGIPLNTLYLTEWDSRTGSIKDTVVPQAGVDYPMFRGGIVVDRIVHWVVYDNLLRKNFVRRFAHGHGGWRPVGSDVELPSLEDPAGSTYEMEPPLFLNKDDGALRVTGGTLDATLHDNIWVSRRLSDCRRVLEVALAPQGAWILCNRKIVDERGAYILHRPGTAGPETIPYAAGVPWDLRWEAGDTDAHYQLARTTQDYSRVLEFDLSRSQHNGMLEFGADNIEGRIPWSQIYYLNGFLDLLYLAGLDGKAFDILQPLLAGARMRIELEIRLLDDLLMESSALSSRAFTKDRVPAIFAVQSSRFLLLFDRYRRIFPDASRLITHERLRKRVLTLDQHIEKLSSSGEAKRWAEPGTRHLRWPKGSAFFFDGMPVPYNHQNEWAYAVFESSRQTNTPTTSRELEPQREMIRHFLRHLSPDGGFPEVGGWHYWWGHAFDGYSSKAGLSTNKPEYPGDKSLAWVSFRTIDLMSVLSSMDFLPGVDRQRLLASAQTRIETGDVYPFAARSMHEANAHPGLMSSVAFIYARSGAPWELSNQPWALVMLPAKVAR